MPEVPESALVDTVWALESLVMGGDDGAVSSVPDGYTLELRSDGTFAASGGCPPIEGRFEISSGEVRITESGIDGDIACLVYDPTQDHVNQVIGSGFRVEIEEDRLIVTNLRGGQGMVYRSNT